MLGTRQKSLVPGGTLNAVKFIIPDRLPLSQDVFSRSEKMCSSSNVKERRLVPSICLNPVEDFGESITPFGDRVPYD